MLKQWWPWLSPKSGSDCFRLRWDFIPTEKGQFTNAKKDDIVRVLAVKQHTLYTAKDGTVSCVPLVYVFRTGKRGFISPDYLIPVRSLGPARQLPKDIKRFYNPNGFSDEILNARWYMGQVGPVEAGLALRTNPSYMAGSYVVCSPHEYHSPKKWSDLMLLVRVYTGTEDCWVEEWKEDFLKSISAPTVPLECDHLPGFKQPVPIIVHIRIRRTTRGRYFIYGFREESFVTVFELLNFYTGKELVLIIPRVFLREPAQISRMDMAGPQPPPIPTTVKTPERPASDFCGLLKYLKAPASSAGESRFERQVDLGRGCVAKTFAGLIRHGAESRSKTIVVIKELDEMDKDGYEDLNCQLQKLNPSKKYDSLRGTEAYYMRGMTYLTDIVAVELNPKLTLIAYEFMQLGPLDRLLRERQRTQEVLPQRSLLEVLYQVVCGMRHLEENNVAHRALAARNVMVKHETRFAVVIKLTDYAQPPPAHRRICKDAWRWMGLDSLLHNDFDIKADSWAFGHVVCEVMTHGELPYSQHDDIDDAEALVAFLSKGGRMKRPTTLPTFLWNVVLHRCWAEDANFRLSFKRLFNFFNDLLFDTVNGANKAILDYEKESKADENTYMTGQNVPTADVGQMKYDSAAAAAQQ